MPTERQLANLKPFKPGQSGNPGGRPKKILSDRYRAMLESAVPAEIARAMKLPEGALWADALTLQSMRTGLKANETGVLQRRELADRLEGKSVQRTEFLSDETVDIRVSFEDTSKLLNARTPAENHRCRAPVHHRRIAGP
jgi:hypothetical protein